MNFATKFLRGRASSPVVISVATLLILVTATAYFAMRQLPRSSDQQDPATTKGAAVDFSTGEFSLTDVTQELGIDFVHDPGPPSFFYPAIIGSGVALLDYDQDGRLDIYFRSGTSGPPHPLAESDTLRVTSRLYHQEADGRFVDVTEKSGLCDTGYGMGVAVGDINNDGYPDVFAVNFNLSHLYLNQRDGTFVDITESAGIGSELWGTSATFVDIDRDGRLDLFVANYVDYSKPQSCTAGSGREDFCNVLVFPPTTGKLYRNITDLDRAKSDASAVRFEDVTETSGIASQSGRGLGVRAGDFDDDGWPDIYVANDRSANFLWMNQHDGTFRDLAIPLGSAYDGLGRPTASMGIAEGDVDGDGTFDLLVTNLRGESNTLYRKSSADFRDVTSAAGLQRPSLPHTGWGVALADLDHDGDLDIVVVNGHVYQPLDKPVVRPPTAQPATPAAVSAFWHAYADPNQVFLNDGTGKFKDISKSTGRFAQELESSRGLALGDIDNDGDLDFIVTNLGGPARVYRNEFKKKGRWLVLRLIDPGLGGRDAYGAIVTVVASGRKLVRRVQPGASFESSDDPQIHLGLGDVEQIDYIEVRWPDGEAAPERFSGCAVNSRHVLRRGDGTSQ